MLADRAACAEAPAWPAVLLLLAAYLLSTGWNLHLQEIENPDEPRYACAARDMAGGTGSWLVPVFNGEPRLKKPILLYWAMALSAKALAPLGIGMVTAFRLVPLAFGALAVLAAYGLGRRLFGARAGLLSGLALLTTYYFHATTREILIDPLLTGCLAAAWGCFVALLQRLKSEPARTPYGPLVGLYVMLGLACLAKGPGLVAIFAVLPMTVYLVWERRSHLPANDCVAWLLLRAGVLWGVPLALGIGFSWFAALYAAGYGEDVWRFFKEQNFDRGIGALDHNEGLKGWPFLWYFQDLPGKFVPWVVLLIPAGWWFIRRDRNGALLTAETRLLLCGTLIPFVVMGLAGSKRSLYLLPLYPLLAVWSGLALERLAYSRTTPDAASFSIRTALKSPCVVALLLLAGLGLVFEAAIRPKLAADTNRAAFFAAMDEPTRGRPLAWFGGSANEAVWYLNRPVRRLLAAHELKDAFYGRPGARLLVREKEFLAYPALQASVKELQRLRYDKKSVILLVEADPSRPPDPNLFAGAQGGGADEGD